MRPDVDEALRYLGAGEQATTELRVETEKLASELADALQPRYTYKVFDLAHRGEEISFLGTGLVLAGKTAGRMLAQCHRAVLLACTLGTRFDSWLRVEQRRDMSRAVMLNACGSAFVERGCDAAEQEIRECFPNLYLTDRFSPGYGDLPLELQPSICAVLDVSRRLGIHVEPSFLMNPEKSVTAVIGLSDRPQMARIRGCEYCVMRENCLLRKGGNSCAL